MNQNTLEQKLKNELKNKVVLVTGGAGSVGSGLVERLLQYPLKSLRVLDNDSIKSTFFFCLTSALSDMPSTI